MQWEIDTGGEELSRSFTTSHEMEILDDDDLEAWSIHTPRMEK